MAIEILTSRPCFQLKSRITLQKKLNPAFCQTYWGPSVLGFWLIFSLSIIHVLGFQMIFRHSAFPSFHVLRFQVVLHRLGSLQGIFSIQFLFKALQVSQVVCILHLFMTFLFTSR